MPSTQSFLYNHAICFIRIARCFCSLICTHFLNFVPHLISFLFCFYVNCQLIPSPFLTGEFEQVAASVLELPYTGERVSMFLFLPAQEGPQGFANMVSRLSGNNLRAATHQRNLRKQDVDLKLPKFRMEMKLSDEMIPVSADLV